MLKAINDVIAKQRSKKSRSNLRAGLLRRPAEARLLAMTIPVILIALLTLSTLSGCDKATYPEEKIESGIKEICKKEYKIEGVEVKFADRTVAVFLPLKKLFTADVRQEILSGQVANLDSLFEPEPAALEQLENVLFTISRVLLSSNKPIDFYVLQATDIESTGLQLVLMGFVDDVKRVRLWDIPRSEYRKRVLHELRFNRAVLWEKPVRGLLRDVTSLDFDTIAKEYFTTPPKPDAASPLFYDFLITLANKQNVKIEIEKVRSRAYRSSQALVYVKYVETYEPKPGTPDLNFFYPPGTAFEYIFVIEPADKQFKISKIIPLHYLDEMRKLQKVALPADFDLDQNIESWPERFSVEAVTVGEFLARQLNRRVQGLLLGDERIHHTIRHAQVNFAYRDGSQQDAVSVTAATEPHFALYFDFLTKEMKGGNRSISELISNEDILYLFDIILREFADLARSYKFKNFQYLELVWEPGTTSVSLKLDPNRLDLFRLKKLDIANLLESPAGPKF